MTSAESAITARRLSWQLGAYVVGAIATPDGRAFAVGLGDGTVGFLDLTNAGAGFVSHPAHDGACLCFSADIVPGAVLSGGDDGKLVSVKRDGTRETVADAGKRWVDHVETHAGAGIRVYATGKDVVVMKKGEREPRRLTHPSAVGGLAINPKGKRLAVTHYGGVSLWWLAAKDGKADALAWKGSHLQTAWSPGGTYIVTAMQESALHGWRLSDSQHFRMEGYAAKIRALSFNRRGTYLATGGADSVVCWPFTGGGPMGKSPLEFGGVLNGPPVTAALASPKLDVIAAGFADGRVIVGQPGSPRVMPVAPGRRNTEGAAITALAWTPDGERLLSGSEDGEVHVADFRLLIQDAT